MGLSNLRDLDSIATTDASFSCAWNQSSDKFAVASQDGFVSVWDIRHSEKLCKLGSKQVGQAVTLSPFSHLYILSYRLRHSTTRSNDTEQLTAGLLFNSRLIATTKKWSNALCKVLSIRIDRLARVQ